MAKVTRGETTRVDKSKDVVKDGTSQCVGHILVTQLHMTETSDTNEASPDQPTNQDAFSH